MANVKLYVMVRDEKGNRFNPRVGGYTKSKCVFELTKKFPVVEVRTNLYGNTEYGFFKGMRMTGEQLHQRVISLLWRQTDKSPQVNAAYFGG